MGKVVSWAFAVEKSVSDIKQGSIEVSSRISSDSLVACLQSKADAEKVCQNSQGTDSVDVKGLEEFSLVLVM